jgi:hypothetical protein
MVKGWRKLYHEECHSLYCSSNIRNKNDQVKEDERDRECGTHGEKINAYWALMGKPKAKKQLGRSRSR